MDTFDKLQPSYEDLVERADFDWMTLLIDAGAGAYLTGRNGDCPCFGGRYNSACVRVNATWVCRHCTGGFGSCQTLLKWRTS